MYQGSKHKPARINGRLVARTRDEGPGFCAISNTIDQVVKQLSCDSAQWADKGYLRCIVAASDEQTFTVPDAGTATIKFSITGGSYAVEPLPPVHVHELVYDVEQLKEALWETFYYNGTDSPLKENFKAVVLVEQRNVVIEFTPDQLGFQQPADKNIPTP